MARLMDSDVAICWSVSPPAEVSEDLHSARREGRPIWVSGRKTIGDRRQWVMGRAEHELVPPQSDAVPVSKPTLGDPFAVEKRAVPTSEVDQQPVATPLDHFGMMARDTHVAHENDVIFITPADRKSPAGNGVSGRIRIVLLEERHSARREIPLVGSLG